MDYTRPCPSSPVREASSFRARHCLLPALTFDMVLFTILVQGIESLLREPSSLSH